MTERAGSKGVSLAKGPIAILGLVGIVYGLSGLIFASHGFSVHFPHGAVTGKHWIGLLVNGWSELLFIAAGLALLLFSPLHWAAKTMSTLVGLVLIAAAVVAAIRGNGVFGIFAANKRTEVVWAAAGVLSLILALLPRVGGDRGRRRSVGDAETAGDVGTAGDDVRPRRGRTAAEPEPVTRQSPSDVDARDTADVDREPVTRRPTFETEPRDSPETRGTNGPDDR